jgi:hypothetical protein
MITSIGVRKLLMRIAGYIYGQTASIQVYDLIKIKLCAMVIVGVNDRVQKHFLSIEVVYESPFRVGERYC